MASSTSSILQSQWRNPNNVSSILLIIGGDVVRMAFSQGAGTSFTPVCFSFGCVAYAFIGLMCAMSDGRLLSPPDSSCKILNLTKGYALKNNSFVISRLLRDMEATEARRDKNTDHHMDLESQGNLKTNHREPGKERGDYEIRISVFEALHNCNGPAQMFMSKVHFFALLVTLAQIGIATIPYFLNRSWNVLLVTLTGTTLVQCTGLLPQWTVEKLPNQQNSKQVYALTSGSNSREVMVIAGRGKCLDLESLAAMQTPRTSRPWEKIRWLSNTRLDSEDTTQHQAKLCRTYPFRGLPIGFALTQAFFVCISVLWLLLLVNLSVEQNFPEGWCFISIGALGMLQNSWLAFKEISPQMRNLPLSKIQQIRSKNIMDGIMDFHMLFGGGKALLKEFCPGPLNPDEEAWWSGYPAEYDATRGKEGRPGCPKKSKILGWELRDGGRPAENPFSTEPSMTRSSNAQADDADQVEAIGVGESVERPDEDLMPPDPVSLTSISPSWAL